MAIFRECPKEERVPPQHSHHHFSGEGVFGEQSNFSSLIFDGTSIVPDPPLTMVMG